MKKKILAISVIAILILVALLSVNVQAESNTDSLEDLIGDAENYETIYLESGEYDVGNLTISKPITIIGAGKSDTVITGNIIVESDLTLKDLTVSSSSAAVKVNAAVTLNVENCIIKDASYNYDNDNYTFGTYTEGITLVKGNADGATLNVTNSEVYALYAIWINGKENIVTIDSSTVGGWAALDITYGDSAETLANSNRVTVTNSTLIGMGVMNGDSNEYATIVIGAQDGLVLDITNTEIKNIIQSDNPEDLISFDEHYLTNKNVTITIKDSKLYNTDTANGSKVFAYQNAENMAIENKNIIKLANTEINSEISGNIYSNIEGYIILTLVTQTNSVILPLEAGTTFSDAIYTAEGIDGYTFEGWYMDDQYQKLYDNTALKDRKSVV